MIHKPSRGRDSVQPRRLHGVGAFELDVKKRWDFLIGQGEMGERGKPYEV